MKLTELKNLDPKKPGLWPWPAKILSFVAIFSVVIVAGFFLFWQEQWATLGRVKAEEDKLKETFMAKKKEAINLDLIKKQLNETKESLGALLKQLPNKSEMDALLTDINQAGLGRGLKFEFFKPGNEKIIGSFAELPIAIKVSGDYDDIGNFSSDIAMLPRIVTLNDIKISPSGGKESGLKMEAVAKTFRYLDEEELANQAAAKGKAKGRGRRK